MKVFQIGAAGGVGRRLTARLVAGGDQVSGMYRHPTQAGPVEQAGATPVTGDLIANTVAEFAAKMGGHDAVVFSAGAHGTGRDQTTLIDGKGLEKAAAAATLAGVNRFVLVSVFPDALRGQEPNEAFEHYIRVKKTADAHLTGTDLDWIIVRPGTLTDDPGTDRVAAQPALVYGDVSRDNVAAFIDAALHEPALTRTIVELTDGDLPVAEAVAGLTTS